MEKQSSNIELVHAIENKMKTIHSRSLDISFNELFDMYKNNELKIQPAFQRTFRWSRGTQSRFIESLILEMPIPPIFVIEDEVDNSFILIDGLQRISTYINFRGELKEPEGLNDELKKQYEVLCLDECDIVEELNGKYFKDLPTALSIKLKRYFVRVQVIKKETLPDYRYHMFKRLNTGGAPLSAQEVRNCTIRLLDNTFNDFIIKLSEDPFFLECIDNISDADKMNAFSQELVLRFFAFKNYRASYDHDVGDFLTEFMEKISKQELPFDYLKEEDFFIKLFKLLSKTLGVKVFGRANNKDHSKITSGFSVYHYEAISVGVAECLDQILQTADYNRIFKDALNSIKTSDNFYNLVTGGGKNSSGQLERRINYVKDKLKKAF